MSLENHFECVYVFIICTKLVGCSRAKKLSAKKTRNAAWKAGDTLATWEKCSWAKKLSAKKTRASLSDFDRFKVMVAKKQKSEIIAKKMVELGA